MSIDKLLFQAEKLLDKGKVEEAIQKFQEVLRSDPNNQQASNKIAQAYVTAGLPEEAVRVFERMAAKASDAGRSQVAVALLKQALTLLPDSIVLLSKLATECENIGKLSEANSYGQQVLAYYVARKKYIEALPICGLLARVSPKDEKIKSAWLELLMYVGIEDKILPALVYFCGPPGLADKEFPVGGDPASLSENLYRQLMALQAWYPKSVKLSYTLGWAAYKRGNLGEAFGFIREALRRDPDCTLNILLLARIFSDQKKLNECYFVYKYAKDRVMVDKTVETATLTKQLASFEEKNGWITFNEGMGDGEALTPDKFLALFEGPSSRQEPEATDAPPPVEAPSLFAPEPQAQASSTPEDGSEVALPSFDSNAQSEILLTSGDTKMVVPSDNNVPEPDIPEPKTPSEEIPIKTEIFSPLDALKAASWRKDVSVEPKEPNGAPPPPAPKPTALEDESPINSEELFSHNSSESSEADSKREATQVMSSIPADERAAAAPPPVEENLLESFQEEVPDPSALLPGAERPVVKFVPMPEMEVASPAEEPKFKEELPDADLGSDLLLGPTKVTEAPEVEQNKTEQFVAELKKEEITADTLLRKGERFLAKRNYYLARKSFRQALVLGADEEVVKEKLRLVRTLEMPESMYAKISNDSEPSSNIDDLVRALQIDFDIEEEVSKKEILGKISRTKFQRTMKDVDGRTCLDLGVAFFEMGLFRDAESIFTYAVQQDESLKFEAFYLMAESMMARNDFSAAVNTLKALAIDTEKSEREKLPVYYLLGQAFEKMQQPRRSKKYFEKVASLNGNYRDVKEKLGLN